MPVVINALGDGHIDTHTHTHTRTHTHTHTHTYQHANQSNFKKPGTHGLQPHAPGLINEIKA